jgi:hypothetical protein
MSDGTFWLDVTVNGRPYSAIGPFVTETERQKALDDLLEMLHAAEQSLLSGH